MKNITLSLILPCYNEAQHFSNSTDQILHVLKKNNISFEIIFVEDKSQDATKMLVKDFIKRQHASFIKALYHDFNQGRGKSVADGIKKTQGKFVGFIDIDCEISPRYIPVCIKRLQEGYDVVSGERHYEISLRGILRAVLSKFYAILVKIILGTKLTDTEAGYKFFRKSKILPILKEVKDSGWFWDTEIMIRSERKGLKMIAIPVVFQRRSDKTSTVHLLQDTLDYLKKLLLFRLELFKNSL